jgi:hypothetical protein
MTYIAPQPEVIIVPPPIPEQRAFVPWSPEWFQYCTSRYRTFDRSSGYYNGYDGQRHFCQ